MRFTRPLAAALLIGACVTAQGFGAAPAAAQPAPQPYPDGGQGGPPPGPGGPGGYGQPPSPGPGQPGQHMTGAQKFDAANVTHDGRLTRDQAAQAGFHVVARHFDEIDRDHKGYVTKQDIREWHHARRAAMAAARQQQQGAPPQGQPPQGPPPQGQPYPGPGYQEQQAPPPQ